MFQQRHFDAIAQTMQALKPRDNWERERQWIATVNALANLFARHNSRFMLGKFERACEPGANVRARKVV